MQYADSLYYGAWLRPGDTLFYNEVGCGTELYKTTETSITSIWQPICAITSTTPISFTNTTANPISLDNIGASNRVWRNVLNYDLITAISFFINAQYCTHLDIENLVINGNSENCLLGGTFGDGGIQIEYGGVYFYNCKKVPLNIVHSIHLDKMALKLKGKVQILLLLMMSLATIMDVVE